MTEPHLVMIEQTNKCNLKCIACPNRLKIRPIGEMERPVMDNIIHQLLSGHVSRLTRVALHGFGEPLMSSHLFKNLELLDVYGFNNVDITTNGMLLTPEVISKLHEHHCISWVRVSLNSSNKDEMERMNVGADFDTVVENIRNLLLSSPPFKVVVQHMVNAYTEHEDNDDFFRVIKHSGFVYTKKDYHNYYGQVENDLIYGHYNSCGGDFGRDVIIQWDGDLVGCCSDNTKTQVYGNIREGIFSKEVRERKNRMAHSHLPLCERCMR